MKCCKNLKYKYIKFFTILLILSNLEIKRNINIDMNDSIYEAARKAKNFITLTSEGLLFSKKSGMINIYPKVSVVVPVYNIEKSIKQNIRSIQNQNLLEFEIILVNDHSSDNTFNIIENIKKEDKRIKLINNKKNMGLLYTRCIGTLSSKGKYIFPLDGDDMFLNKNIIKKIYNIVELKKADIIVFKFISVYQFNDIIKLKILVPVKDFIKKESTYRQPKLSLIHRVVIWSQCIRANIYKKAINIYGEKRYSNYINYYEDAIINHIIYQIASSSIFVPIFGILHLIRRESISHSTTKIKINYSTIKYIEIMIEFLNNIIEVKDEIAKRIIYYLNKKDFRDCLNDTNFNNTFRLLIYFLSYLFG